MAADHLRVPPAELWDIVPEPAWASLRLPTDRLLALSEGNRAKAYYLLGRELAARTQTNEQDAAIYTLATAHRLAPQAAAYNELGTMLRARGRPEARAVLNKALLFTPHAAASTYRNLALLPDTSQAEALELLRSAVRLAPSDAGGWLALASASRTANDLSAAQKATEEAVQLAPGAPDIARLYGDWRAWDKDFRERRARVGSPADIAGIGYQASLQFPLSAAELKRIASAHAAHAIHAAVPTTTHAAQPARTARRTRLRVAYVGALSDEPQIRAVVPLFRHASRVAQYSFLALTAPPAGDPDYMKLLRHSLPVGALRPMEGSSAPQLAAALTGGAEGGEAEEEGFDIVLDGAWKKECHPDGSSLTRLNCEWRVVSRQRFVVPGP